MTIYAGRLIDEVEFHNVALQIVDGKVASMRPFQAHEIPGPEDVDARNTLLVPGFVDTHVHGGFGLDLMDGDVKVVEDFARHLPSMGVTAFLVTPLTAPWPAIRKACVASREACTDGGAVILGIHLEGPFLAPEYKGAQRADEMQAPNFAVLDREIGDLLAHVKIMTIAAELPGSLETISRLRSADIQPSIGHSAATYDEVSAAIDAGACRVTHCFNAMRGLHHREPGVAGAALARPELVAEIIWDGIHVHPEVCNALCAAKGPGGVVAISDGTTGVGMQDGYKFPLWGLKALVSGGAARLEDGTLAGSVIGMAEAFRNIATARGIPDAVRLCSRNPAESLAEYPERGSLIPGSRADFVVMDQDLSVVSTHVGGRSVFTAVP